MIHLMTHTRCALSKLATAEEWNYEVSINTCASVKFFTVNIHSIRLAFVFVS